MRLYNNGKLVAEGDTALSPCKGVLPEELPYSLFHGGLCTVTKYEVTEWASRRTFSAGRVNLNEILDTGKWKDWNPLKVGTACDFAEISDLYRLEDFNEVGSSLVLTRMPSYGRLDKIRDGGRIYKGNSKEEVIEPIAEHYCSRISALFQPTVISSIATNKEVRTYGTEYVSVSDFICGIERLSDVKAYTNPLAMEYPTKWLQMYGIDKDDIIRMYLVDSMLENNRRDVTNIHLHRDSTGKLLWGPVLSFGGSMLFAWYEELPPYAGYIETIDTCVDGDPINKELFDYVPFEEIAKIVDDEEGILTERQKDRILRRLRRNYKMLIEPYMIHKE